MCLFFCFLHPKGHLTHYLSFKKYPIKQVLHYPLNSQVAPIFYYTKDNKTKKYINIYNYIYIYIYKYIQIYIFLHFLVVLLSVQFYEHVIELLSSVLKIKFSLHSMHSV